VSYQVNFRVFIPDCEYWEAEKMQLLQQEMHEAVQKLVTQAGLHKRVGMTSAEVVYLNN
jgi:hypothetical protein